MRKLVLFFVLFAFASCGENGCEMVGCGTLAKKPVNYNGNPNADDPYILTGKVYVRDNGCTGGSCDYVAGLRPVLHNPLNKKVTVNIDCRYFFDGVPMGRANRVEGLVILARSSRKLEGFDYIFSSSHRVALSAECCADFGTDGTHCDTNSATEN